MVSKTNRLLLCGLIAFAFFYATAVSQDDNPKRVKIYDDANADVTFKSTIVGSDLADIIWCGKSKDSVLVVTEGGVVYYSTNGGLEWKKLKEIFEKSGQRVSDDEDVGTVNELMQSPVDSDLIFFIGSEGVHWYTEDCGRTIRAIDAGRKIKTFQFHPTKREWVLATAFTECDEESDKPCKTSQELYSSQDLGKTWTFLVDYVIQSSWAYRNTTTVVPEQRIVVTQDLRTSKSQKLGAWSENVHLILSDDFFKTQKAVLSSGQKFLVTEDYFFVVRVEDEKEQDVSLYVSDSNMKNYKFKSIVLPTKDKLYERSYVILDTNEKQVFLHINHERVKSKYGNVYISDSTGIRYSLSLRNNVRTSDDLSDFESVMGLEGIFFANVYDPKIVNKLKNEWSSGADIPTERTRKGKDSAHKQPNKREQELDDFKQSMMTFDKGGMWEKLTPPKFDAQGERIECEDKECSLHLHSISNMNFGPFYSTDNSLGLILGTGNVGKYLSNKEDEVNTYLSRDGGLNWYEIKQGSHIYEIGDHGSLIVVANDQKATQYIYYTWNEGISWQTLKVSETPIEITNIIIEPSNTAQKFVIYGRTSTSTTDSKGVIRSRKGVLIGLDFTSLHERYCDLPDRPDDANSDYETWTPTAYLSGSCLMGHQVTYVRRKRQSECFNPQEFDKIHSFKNCECTEEDWECDLGYERKNNGPCVLSKGSREPSIEPPEECYGYYAITSGYRKVAGNTCEGGVNHDPIKFRCPSRLLSMKNATALLGIALVGLVVWLFMNKKEQVMDVWKQIASRARAGTSSTRGFARLGQEEGADAEEDHDDLAGKLKFIDDGDEKSIPMEDKDTTTGKRMTERKGLETASKKIPVVVKPGEQKQQQQPKQLLDDDEDDLANFDPRQ